MRIGILLLLALIAALPFALRPERRAGAAADGTLVIITPHNEAIRHEFGRGFEAWHLARTGRTVAVDWRVIGGTSEIARYLDGAYAGDRPGSGLDLFFGGGSYDFIRQAQAGRLVDSGIQQTRPEWFNEGAIPPALAGQRYRDAGGLWIGTVISTFGLIYNRDVLARLGVGDALRQWSDLQDPRLFGEVALCDPTKSGSIAAAFESVLQQQMQRRLTELRAASGAGAGEAQERQAVGEGWVAGLRIVQLAGANARYFTDTSQKPPIDVAAGNCAVGMCIDFYGRQQEEAVRRRAEGSERVGFVTPAGGSVANVDSIAMLRGAPHPETAKRFVEFVLSPEGQKLWNFRTGTPGGPERFALRRLPVRRDFYAREDWGALRSDPGVNPFAQEEQLEYRAAWTGGLFREMSFIIRVMCIDTHAELKGAWGAIIAAPEPAKARALAVLQDLSAVTHAEAGGRIRTALAARDRTEEIRLARELGDFFRGNYARAKEIAEGR